ncbi:MAG: hypothetical protein ACYC18_09265 [Gammaproteobacteria bacterium]
MERAYSTVLRERGGLPESRLTRTPARGRVAAYLAEDPALQVLYAKILDRAHPIISSNYDLTRQCNLRCEGCLFFEGEDYEAHEEELSLRHYDALFRAERRRGVNFPYFVGAEPALVQERLRVAARYFARGVVFTNGTVKIDTALPYAIHVSLWGDAASTRRLRGGRVFRRPLHNYQGDPRATFIFTINHQNLRSIPKVVSLCRDHGLRISFSHFSATERYLGKIHSGAHNDPFYFRFSRPDDNLRLTTDDLRNAHDLLQRMIDDFPETVIYSPHYNDWISQPQGLYTLDPETGWALDCETRNAPFHRHYHTDLTRGDGKCCSPNIDCGECRAYAMSYATLRHRIRQFLGSRSDFARWLEVVDTWCRLFIVGWAVAPPSD